jgi:hypothetical protein
VVLRARFRWVKWVFWAFWIRAADRRLEDRLMVCLYLLLLRDVLGMVRGRLAAAWCFVAANSRLELVGVVERVPSWLLWLEKMH